MVAKSPKIGNLLVVLLIIASKLITCDRTRVSLISTALFLGTSFVIAVSWIYCCTYDRDDLNQKNTTPPYQSPRTISTADPADHNNGNTGSRADSRPLSRTQGSVPAAGRRLGCCGAMGTARTTFVSGLHTLFSMYGVLPHVSRPQRLGYRNSADREHRGLIINTAYLEARQTPPRVCAPSVLDGDSSLRYTSCCALLVSCTCCSMPSTGKSLPPKSIYTRLGTLIRSFFYSFVLNT